MLAPVVELRDVMYLLTHWEVAQKRFVHRIRKIFGSLATGSPNSTEIGRADE
jgi:hypothetical protein